MPQSIESAICLPVPAITTLPEQATREDRLRAVIQNLDVQHGRVRANIVSLARSELADASSLRDASDRDSDAMDLDTPTPPPVSDHSQLLANLNAPYVEGSDDPCLGTRNPLPHPDPNIKQCAIPPEIRVLRAALDQLERYEHHARQTRGFYMAALDRYRQVKIESEGDEGGRGVGGGGGGGGGPGVGPEARRASTPFIGGLGMGPPRRASAVGLEGQDSGDKPPLTRTNTAPAIATTKIPTGPKSMTKQLPPRSLMARTPPPATMTTGPAASSSTAPRPRVDASRDPRLLKWGRRGPGEG